ncbi:alpha/beta hydrolase [Anaerotruncus rubiinfantis]|uniref:alpha/beta hydrolase n=1 Tax=Anaerotruncus rubiinfantis TaxID=1720200 RepID=UPI00082D68C2|nr:alpha/beta fold hydrolase [Anaerotruncus rubiinfantis]
MKRTHIEIAGIPAVLWGEQPGGRLFLAVHGNLSHKEDEVIALFAKEADLAGSRTLSFDLPGHGARKAGGTACKVQDCVRDLRTVLDFALEKSDDLGLFACSMGAYFSLIALEDAPIRQAAFLSPVTDMEALIRGMMQAASVSEARLQAEQEIDTPFGQTLYWDYFCYVREHPVKRWEAPTEILSGSLDSLCPAAVTADFARRFCCGHTVMAGGEHFFHTAGQLEAFRQWLREKVFRGKKEGPM